MDFRRRHHTAFLGNRLVTGQPSLTTTNTLTMRKQKASDRRTRRMQRGEDVAVDVSSRTITSSPMAAASWQHKKLAPTRPRQQSRAGRGRARKRSNLYNTLSSYHGHFLSLLTAEYRAEVGWLKARIPSRFGAESLSRCEPMTFNAGQTILTLLVARPN